MIFPWVRAQASHLPTKKIVIKDSPRVAQCKQNLRTAFSKPCKVYFVKVSEAIFSHEWVISVFDTSAILWNYVE